MRRRPQSFDATQLNFVLPLRGFLKTTPPHVPTTMQLVMAH